MDLHNDPQHEKAVRYLNEQALEDQSSCNEFDCYDHIEPLIERITSFRVYSSAEIFELVNEHYNSKLDNPIPRISLQRVIVSLTNLNRIEDKIVKAIKASQNSLDPLTSISPKRKLTSQSFNSIEPDFSRPALVEGLLDFGTASTIYGLPNAGKSFFAIDLAVSVASGMPFFGRKTLPGFVLYVATEGGVSTANRLVACRINRKLGETLIPLELVTTRIDLYSSKVDAEAIIELVNEKILEYDKPPVLIIFDTLARVMAGGNENQANDMGRVIFLLDLLREKTGAHVSVVHHSGKDPKSGPRGSNSLNGAVDSEILIAHGKATVTKQRDMEFAPPIHFKIEQMEISDKRGNKKKTAIISQTIEIQKPKLGPPGEKGLSSLHKCLGLCGEENSESIEGIFRESNHSVLVKDWQSQFYSDYHEDSNPSTASSSFSRARKELEDKRWILIAADKVTLQ